jgi:general secretion pathway protein C
MVMTSQSRWVSRTATVAVWALAGASAVYWGLRISAPQPVLAAAIPVAPPPMADPAAVARLLGSVPEAAPAAAAPPSLASRFALVGVLAGRSGHGGAALISVDGQPAKPYRIGSEVDPGLVVQSLGARQAALGNTVQGPATLTLEMPLLR